MSHSELVPVYKETYSSYGLAVDMCTFSIPSLTLYNDHIPNKSISKVLTSAWPIVDFDKCCSLFARFDYHSTFVAVGLAVRCANRSVITCAWNVASFCAARIIHINWSYELTYNKLFGTHQVIN